MASARSDDVAADASSEQVRADRRFSCAALAFDMAVLGWARGGFETGRSLRSQPLRRDAPAYAAAPKLRDIRALHRLDRGLPDQLAVLSARTDVNL